MRKLYVDPNSHAAQAVKAATAAGDLDIAAKLKRIADQPTGFWVGPDDHWHPIDRIEAVIDAAVTAAHEKGQSRLIVVYGIPRRDGDGKSAGGAKDGTSYTAWIARLARGLKRRHNVMIALEPDSSALTDFLSPEELNERLDLLSTAVDILTAAGALVYVDAGSFNWIPAAKIAPRLIQAGVAHAQGFALGISDTERPEDQIAFAEQLRTVLSELGAPATHYIVDTGRSGAGSGDGAWCNSLTARLGKPPTLNPSIPNCDGLLWIKPPGNSDGDGAKCNNGPKAGDWWLAGALRLLSP